MLSILIPTYNYNSSALVEALHSQGEHLSVPFEILVGDDGSTEAMDWLEQVAALSHVRVLREPINVGRSAIRNRLASEAQYPYLIFMDGDAEVCSDSYLSDYQSYAHPNRVVVGGTAYVSSLPNKSVALRYKYGVKREANSKYNDYFTTFNFMIPKAIFEQVGFDTTLKGYGHEDLIFGMALKKLPVQFLYIHNALLHQGLDGSTTFIKKTEQANANLLSLYQSGRYPELTSASKLLRLYVQLQRWHLLGVTAWKYRVIRPLLLKNLEGSHPRLHLFDLYKIGQLCNYSVFKMSKLA